MWVWLYRIVAGIFTGLGVVALIPPAEEEVVEPVVEPIVEPIVDSVATADSNIFSYIAIIALLTLSIYFIFGLFKKK